MTRRKFVGSLGASTVLPAVAASLWGGMSQAGSQNVGRHRLDLNGSWVLVLENRENVRKKANHQIEELKTEGISREGSYPLLGW
jgi:hypothetical protein